MVGIKEENDLEKRLLCICPGNSTQLCIQQKLCAAEIESEVIKRVAIMFKSDDIKKNLDSIYCEFASIFENCIASDSSLETALNVNFDNIQSVESNPFFKINNKNNLSNEFQLANDTINNSFIPQPLIYSDMPYLTKEHIKKLLHISEDILNSTRAEQLSVIKSYVEKVTIFRDYFDIALITDLYH